MTEEGPAPSQANDLEMVDSRRLTGANLLWDHPGAVLDIELSPYGERAHLARATGHWEEEARRILDAVGWNGEATRVHRFSRGASLAISAPIDALYAATEVNELAWEATLDRLAEREPVASLEVAAHRLRELIAEERNPRLLELAAAAREHGLLFLSDDDDASVGAGRGSRTWATSELPAPETIDWSELHDIPTALITGTNGKTTTVRLIAAMVRESGLIPGLCSTEGIRVGESLVEDGDYSGPGGARAVLRHPEVEIALLETARGGLLRRGLGTDRAEVAVVTNVAADHLGEFGVEDVPGLAEVKLVVARAARSLVLNADDAVLVEVARKRGLEPVWFSLDGSPTARAALEQGDTVYLLDGVELVRQDGVRRTVLAESTQMPLALGGAARHNVANALAACAVAGALEIPDPAVRRALVTFGSRPEDNPGRLNLYRVGGIEVIVDFAHNPHGLAALLATVRARARRRLSVVLGQAGDRSDDSIRDLAATVARLRPDHYVVKNLADYLRGREPGEVEALIEDELVSRGVPAASIERAAGEVEALERGVAWAEPGDLVLQITHSHRDDVIARIEELASAARAQ